ncbi:MAG: LPXTG cell wall anchor domain-containing protein [Paludibacteraceae bacterium]|nr:LPXTG cell wall anchor domain-containing protein [Paludibacteraceae bacterium]MBN2787476.1 LPXTG cell wall anchor domain-containing protein [Paludibacteraceae bacterium]
MKNLLKALGPIIVLLGVVFLVIYFFGKESNSLLVAAGVSMVVGLVVYVFTNKRLKE